MESEFPQIKGLEVESFKNQLDFLQENYTIVNTDDIFLSLKGKLSLPEKSCWLTFDDGYRDHYDYVLPELLKRKLQGSFFPPVLPITERKLLDVNSIHFILASVKDKINLMNTLNDCCLARGVSKSELGFYWKKYGKSSLDRFDDKETIYIKRMLQHILPEQMRKDICSFLFEKYLNMSEYELANNLYMSFDDIKRLISSGMYVGNHGYKHYWLDQESYDSQKEDIEKSLSFLEELGSSTKNWVMCYPYGAYNKNTLRILQEKNCSIGLSTVAGDADFSIHNKLELPRFDTNDFPK